MKIKLVYEIPFEFDTDRYGIDVDETSYPDYPAYLISALETGCYISCNDNIIAEACGERDCLCGVGTIRLSKQEQQ